MNDPRDILTDDQRETFERVRAGMNGKRHRAAEPTMDDDQHDPAQDATELAAAMEVARLHGARIRYHADRGEWLIFAGTHWQADKTGEVDRLVKAVARESLKRMKSRRVNDNLALKQMLKLESAAGISAIKRLLATEPGISKTTDDFDRDDFLLSCENGTLELRTGTLRPHRADDLITKSIPVVYDPQAQCPLWESALDRSMAGRAEMVAYLRRLAGLCFTGSATVHELFIFHGAGANGKSVVVDTLCGLLADYAAVAPESLLIARNHTPHPTEIADVCGKRLVVASETESGGQLRLQLVKRLTGDAMLKARFMRQDFFTFRRTHKLILVTNNRPKIPESTEAAWRRIRLIPFDVVIPPDERDADLLDKLRSEWPGILSWAVRGCLEWQRTGLNPPPQVLAATEDYKTEADPLADYLSERTIRFDGARVSRADLYADYAAWAQKQGGIDRLDRADLFDRLRRIDGISESAWKVNGATVRGFTGIGLCAGCREAVDNCG